VITTYKEPDSYEPVFCDRKCDRCTLDFDFEGGVEDNAIGISELLMDSEEKISLIPQSNERYNRRNDTEE
jgi:lysine 2,3-aminomutase